MNQELMALLNALLGQGNTTQGRPQGQPQGAPQGAAGFSVPTEVGGFAPQSNFSPVNANPIYGNTVGRFFESNAVTGGRPFQFAQPTQPGVSGNRASRGHDNYWSSLGTPNHSDTMSSILKALQS